VVAYEGGERYLGRWRGWIEAACKERGWDFVINPSDLRMADIIVGFRDQQWDGWMCREWKSGVKAGNAIAAGRPFISQASAAVREIQPHGSTVETPDKLAAAFDYWAKRDVRAGAVDAARFMASTYRLPSVAFHYRQILASVGASCAV
jgi:hypothetical protein